ncbi:NifB/NifX family molybdenum-iron cluster-binding protein [Anaerocolumna sp.]|uniref:NifB/NifX family molybdenum-iron cluster-binding protein n=1 Tax=Anaerocolumna sp. TaxID=2041569 RepID=UPI002FE6ECF3
MKRIAVATDENHNVFQHFGKTQAFTIYELEGKDLKSKNTLSSNGAGHSELVTLLSENNIDVVICGGVGLHAMEGLMEAGMLVIPGAQGDVDVVTASYLDGSLQASEGPTCDHHDHENENHVCHHE